MDPCPVPGPRPPISLSVTRPPTQVHPRRSPGRRSSPQQTGGRAGGRTDGHQRRYATLRLAALLALVAGRRTRCCPTAWSARGCRCDAPRHPRRRDAGTPSSAAAGGRRDAPRRAASLQQGRQRVHCPPGEIYPPCERRSVPKRSPYLYSSKGLYVEQHQVPYN